MKRVIKPGDFVILTGSENENLPNGIYKVRGLGNIYLSVNGWIYKDNGNYCGRYKSLENSIITFDNDTNEMSEMLDIMFIK